VQCTGVECIYNQVVGARHAVPLHNTKTPSVAFHKNIANNPHSGNIVGAIHELPLHRTFGHYHIGSTDILVCEMQIGKNQIIQTGMSELPTTPNEGFSIFFKIEKRY